MNKVVIKVLDAVIFGTYFLLLFLSIFWLLVLFSSKKEEKKKELTGRPFFTTIVPAFNEENSILETLNSLINLEYPEDKKEIIVVNDGSTDRTRELVENFIKNNPSRNITLINQVNMGKGKAMNKGLEVAKGEFFACLDADSFIEKNALMKMLPVFEENLDVAAVCPLMKVKKPSSVLQKVQWCEYTINMFYKFLNSKLNCIHVTPGPFSVYKTEVIKKLGGFSETTITEDLEIAIRLQKYHYKIVQVFDAIVETNAPNSWRGLFKQRIRWYKGSVDNTLAYKELMFNKKYGDFGVMRMPTIILSGVIAIVLVAALFKTIFSRFYHYLMYLKNINFDLITLVKNFSPSFNVLSLPFSKLFIAASLMAISFFIMIYSYKLVKEKITNHGRTWASMITYLSVYGIFITFVWVYIAFMFVTGKRNEW